MELNKEHYDGQNEHYDGQWDCFISAAPKPGETTLYNLTKKSNENKVYPNQKDEGVNVKVVCGNGNGREDGIIIMIDGYTLPVTNCKGDWFTPKEGLILMDKDFSKKLNGKPKYFLLELHHGKWGFTGWIYFYNVIKEGVRTDLEFSTNDPQDLSESIRKVDGEWKFNGYISTPQKGEPEYTLVRSDNLSIYPKDKVVNVKIIREKDDSEYDQIRIMVDNDYLPVTKVSTVDLRPGINVLDSNISVSHNKFFREYYNVWKEVNDIKIILNLTPGRVFGFTGSIEFKRKDSPSKITFSTNNPQPLQQGGKTKRRRRRNKKRHNKTVKRRRRV